MRARFAQALVVASALLTAGLTRPPAAAQEAPPGEDASYLIPQTVFVGDPGQLALPLNPLLKGITGTALEDPAALPRLRNLTITRVELETREETPRLLVDFIAFVPGTIELPPLEIASLRFEGLRVHIASILEAEGNSRVLSEPAASLAAPGTATLIYGAVLGFLLATLLLVFGCIRGIPGLKRWLRIFRRRRVIRSMDRVLRQMRSRLLKDPPGGEEDVLTQLSGEFRIFLGFFLGMNCRSMTAGEFRDLLPGEPGSPLSGLFLCDLFRRCDALRFSGEPLSPGAALSLLDEAGTFTGALDQAERAGAIPGAAG
jgi:hypothetical protein